MSSSLPCWEVLRLKGVLAFLGREAASNPQGTAARLSLVRAVAVVISAGLGILGVTPLEEMR